MLIWPTFDKLIGVPLDKYIPYICLCPKYYICVCKFQDKNPTFTSFETFFEHPKRLQISYC